jgi:hypothetical protein
MKIWGSLCGLAPLRENGMASLGDGLGEDKTLAGVLGAGKCCVRLST